MQWFKNLFKRQPTAEELQETNKYKADIEKANQFIAKVERIINYWTDAKTKFRKFSNRELMDLIADLVHNFGYKNIEEIYTEKIRALFYENGVEKHMMYFNSGIKKFKDLDYCLMDYLFGHYGINVKPLVVVKLEKIPDNYTESDYDGTYSYYTYASIEKDIDALLRRFNKILELKKDIIKCKEKLIEILMNPSLDKKGEIKKQLYAEWNKKGYEINALLTPTKTKLVNEKKAPINSDLYSSDIERIKEESSNYQKVFPHLMSNDDDDDFLKEIDDYMFMDMLDGD